MQENYPLTVRAEGCEANAAAVAFESGDGLARGNVPDAGGAVIDLAALTVIGGQDALAVRTPGGGGDAELVALQSLAELARLGVPEIGLAVLEIIRSPARPSALGIEDATLLAAVFGGEHPLAVGAERRPTHLSARPGQRQELLAGLDIPNANRRVRHGFFRLATQAEQRLFSNADDLVLRRHEHTSSIGAEFQGLHDAENLLAHRRIAERRQAAQGGYPVAVLGVPNPRMLPADVKGIGSRRGEALAVGAECHVAHDVRAVEHAGIVAAARRVPDAHGVVQRGGDHARAVRAEYRGGQAKLMSAEAEEFFAGLGGPDACRFVAARSQDLPAIGTEPSGLNFAA